MARPSGFERAMSQGGCDVVYAVRSYQDGRGAHRCDVVSPDGGYAYPGCYVINGSSNRIGAPSAHWVGDLDYSLHPQVVILHRSGGRLPLVLGKVDNSEITYSAKGGKGDGTEDTPKEVSINDVVYQNDKSRIVLKESTTGDDSDILLEPERHLNVQLESGGTVRISVAGDAGDGPVLATPYTTRDATLVAFMRAVEAWISSVTPTIDAAHAAAVIASLGGAAPAAPILFTGSTPQALDQADVQSAALKLPSTTVSG